VKVVPHCSWRSPGNLAINHITVQSSCSSRPATWAGADAAVCSPGG
jgi:hypothetical protein